MEARKEMGRGGKEDSRRQRLSRSRELGWFPAEDRRETISATRSSKKTWKLTNLPDQLDGKASSFSCVETRLHSLFQFPAL